MTDRYDDDIYKVPDTELRDYIPVRASFAQASAAAREFATRRRCEAKLARREPPLDEFWLILVPYMHAVDDAEQFERDSSREPSGEAARLLAYEEKEAQENSFVGFEDPWWRDEEFDDDSP